MIRSFQDVKVTPPLFFFFYSFLWLFWKIPVIREDELTPINSMYSAQS